MKVKGTFLFVEKMSYIHIVICSYLGFEIEGLIIRAREYCKRQYMKTMNFYKNLRKF